MPIPFIPIIAGGAAAVGINGVMKAKKANDAMKVLKKNNEEFFLKLEERNKGTLRTLEKLGILELKILGGFKYFAETISLIRDVPEFYNEQMEAFEVARYDLVELKNISIAAQLLQNLSVGGEFGAFVGYGAYGAAYLLKDILNQKVESPSSPLQEEAISHGIKSALEDVSHGKVVLTQGGLFLQQEISSVPLKARMMYGLALFLCTDYRMMDGALQNKNIFAEGELERLCLLLSEIQTCSKELLDSLLSLCCHYEKNWEILSNTVNISGKTTWDNFTLHEKKATENTVLIVSTLFQLCQLSLLDQPKHETVGVALQQEAVAQGIQLAKNMEKELTKMGCSQ